MSEDRAPPIDGLESPAGARYGIVWSRFNEDVVSKLLEGAQSCFKHYAVPSTHVHVVQVPGAWELPHAAQALAQSGRFDAIVALGAVIRGGTPHFEYVCQGAASGLARVMLDTGVPVAFGVLTTDTGKQAHERAGGSAGNKGWDAVATAIEMVALHRALKENGITTKRP